MVALFFLIAKLDYKKLFSVMIFLSILLLLFKFLIGSVNERMRAVFSNTSLAVYYSHVIQFRVVCYGGCLTLC